MDDIIAYYRSKKTVMVDLTPVNATLRDGVMSDNAVIRKPSELSNDYILALHRFGLIK